MKLGGQSSNAGAAAVPAPLPLALSAQLLTIAALFKLGGTWRLDLSGPVARCCGPALIGAPVLRPGS